MKSAELLTRLRQALEEERRSAAEELRRYGVDPESGEIAELEGIDENFADSGAASAERSEIFAFVEQARERLAAAEAALARMDAGTYGTCERCGEQIPEARLEARPLSVRCVACAAEG